MIPSSGPDERSDDLNDLIVETRRLILRRPSIADAEALARLANDVHVAENLGNLPHPYGIADARAFIENTEVSAARVNFGIYLKRSGKADAEFVGTVSLMPRDGERFSGYEWRVASRHGKVRLSVCRTGHGAVLVPARHGAGRPVPA